MRKAVLAALLVFTALPLHPAAAATMPTLTTPPAGIHGHPLFDSYFDLAPFGYEEREYFVTGEAATVDGSATAPYTTRMIVRRPTTKFNGTVVIDWVNVTAQFENAVDTLETIEMLMREGFAFVHASIQAAGLCCTPLTPKAWDPVRYAAISHPGDDYAEDILTQVAAALRVELGADRVLAAGQSQSASRLYRYVENGGGHGVIDGFLIHGGGEKIYTKPLTTKVVHLLSDLEADPSPPNPGEPNYRLWEVGATAHSDMFIGYQSVAGHGPRTLADAPQLDPAGFKAIIERAGNYGEQIDPLLATCTVAGATMPMHYAASAALYSLDRWVRGGAAPANGPRFEFAGNLLATDDVGNTKGGIRLPPAEVPVARYETTACGLGGFTVPMTDAQLVERYPTFDGYYAQMRDATDRAERAGWLLPADAIDQMRRACLAKNRWGLDPAEPCVSAVATRAESARAPVPVLPATGGADGAAGGAALVLVALLLRRIRHEMRLRGGEQRVSVLR